MTDDLKTLRDALRSTAAPDAALKARNMAAATECFAQEFAASPQETGAPVRPIPDRSIWARLRTGGISMMTHLTSRAGLAMTTGLVTAGLALVLVLPRDDLFGPGHPADQPRQEASTPVVTLAEGTEPDLRMEDIAAAPEAPQAVPELQGQPTVRAVAEDAPLTEPAPVIARSAKMAAPQGQSEGMTSMVTNAGDVPITAFAPPAENTERFSNADENPVKIVADSPVSTFSIDVDTAAYAVVRSSLMSGHLPPEDAVRVEEMVNYFPYAYPAPDTAGPPFRPTVSVSQTPWNTGTKILHIALQGQVPEVTARPPLNLVFLIDTSGSMQDPDKLPLLKQSFRLMLGQLRPEDQVAIVTYAGSAGQVLAPTTATERATILAALDRLQAGGSTAGQAGLEQAYAVAAGMTEDGEVSRVLLATDGDFNVGIHDPDGLQSFVERKRDSGTYLSVLGFGRGNLNDALMQMLAQNGNGHAAYIDTIAEAQKVLMDQLTGALFPIAQDVKIQVEFNPAEIAEYRLIGYETRALRREDFNNDAVDAGEIGAGHQVTALYEVTPVGSDAVLNDPLRYQAEAPTGTSNGELGLLRLRYKAPSETDSALIEVPIPVDAPPAKDETKFATAIAGFGQMLRGSPYLGNWSYAEAIDLANGARGEDAFGYRAEAIRLMRIAESLSD